MKRAHPELVQPAEAINHEERRRKWVTNRNLINWRKLSKKELVNIGMAVDTPGEIRE